jgi:predicted O-methyltransferase YrrM
MKALQEALALVETIPGWLRPEDAAKLYELASESPGPIVEIGTYHGKSAVLMALAARDAGHDVTVYTLEVDPTFIAAAARQAERLGVAERILFVRGTSRSLARAYPRLEPSLTFVDGDHTRRGTRRDLVALERLVPVGGFVLFHDFSDPRNDDSGCSEVDVRAAVEASWVPAQCDFLGTFGVCGLFRRRLAPPRPGAVSIDLLGLEDLPEQYVRRVRHLARRLVRRADR